MSNNSEYPKVMWVSRTPFEEKCSEENKCIRVVFMEKLDRYLAWDSAENFKDAESVTDVVSWKYAKDIEKSVEKKFDFEEGKWYYVRIKNDCREYFLKYSSNIRSSGICENACPKYFTYSEVINTTVDRYFKFDDWILFDSIDELRLVNLEEIQKYLPEDHPEKLKIVKEEMVVDKKIEVVRSIPYQLCPKCNGTGQMWLGGWDGQSQSFLASGMGICDVCNGNKIIPMYELVQTCKKESGCYNSNGCNCKS